MPRPLRPWSEGAAACARLFPLLLCAGCSELGLESGGGGGGGRFSVRDTKQAIAPDALVRVSGRWLVYLASEASSGKDGRDLNEDGDFLDRIAVAVDMRGGSERSLDVAAIDVLVAGDHLYVVCSEDEDDRDWNGDGATDDLVLLHWRAGGGAPSFVAGLAGPRDVTVVGERVYLARASGAGLVAPQTRLAYLDAAQPTVPVPVLSLDPARVLAPRILAADAGLLFLYEDETGTAPDLNGDGDEEDRFVLALLDATDPSEPVRNVGLAVLNDTLPVRAVPTAPGDWIVAFLVSEARQGGTNLNDPALFTSGWQPPQCFGLEDSDALDNVLHWLAFRDWVAGPALAPPVNTGLAGAGRILAAQPAPGARPWLATLALEAEEGGCSLNRDVGDGNDQDQGDVVLRWVLADGPALPFTAAEGIVALYLADGGTLGATVVGGRFVAIVDEKADRRDRDGAPNQDRPLLAWLDPQQGPNARWTFDHAFGAGQFIATPWMAERGEQDGVLIAMSESGAGSSLNAGDSDLADVLPSWARFDATGPPDLDFVGPPIALAPDQPSLVLAGAHLLYLVDEGADNRDWNKDGDTGDVVLLRTEVDAPSRTLLVETVVDQRKAADPVAALVTDGEVGAAFFSDERRAKKDLNRDGDQTDFVVRWFRF